MMTTSTSPDYAALIALLDNEILLLRTFVETLQQEQQLLARNTDVSMLPTVIAQKTDLYRDLTDIGRQRAAWLVSAAFSGMQSLLDEIRVLDQPLGATLTQRWQTLLGLAREARAHNDTNGRLVRTRMSYNRAALDALRMAGGMRSPSTYGADGRMS